MSAQLGAGFADPVLDAQATFRVLLDVFAHPGRIGRVAPEGLEAQAPLEPAAFALALTLLDFETPVWLDPGLDVAAVRDGLRFHCGCPLVPAPERAAFALVSAPAVMPPLAAFTTGTPEYPDRGATLVLQVARLEEGTGFTLTGPGIRATSRLAAAPLPPDFATRWQANRGLFPQGVDLVLVAGDRLAALPRSTRLDG